MYKAKTNLLLASLDLNDSVAQENLKIMNIAEAEALKRKIQVNWNLKFELGLLNPFCSDLLDERNSLREEQAKRLGTLWLWITVSPNPSVKFLDFKKKIDQTANRKMFSNFYYTFEQRASTIQELGKGFHSHMLLKRDMKYKQNKVIKNLKNSFKNITNTDNHQIFNFHWCPEEYLTDKIEYMSGTKTGKDKDKKQLMDIVFRQKNNLKEYYKCQDEKIKSLTTQKDLIDVNTNADEYNSPLTSPESQD